MRNGRNKTRQSLRILPLMFVEDIWKVSTSNRETFATGIPIIRGSLTLLPLTWVPELEQKFLCKN
jgi:hypothetical protein